ncbi:50S ribosomal protein L11 [Candidatus Curtissbacteria bacterium RIFCSPHIGHO2_01_FULL_41_44]|uniref:Large ribosomal subunit protein uL11 n=1 Tax=Candidatus Curtissbacteria bacterium RIFCSPLOWO2_01_FULL_42_50 TaxID=1797730 RepID=A0A1F5H5K2_9BACT|nr:MAG: 50S ribosomal protein L11 [Candidatus Curtissbacteria bacterium RIFCSPHIGHO2_01_FULL_41_44]OGD93797.1 MAG: 50S ribosomal protein L11 [Candidatus Curtissbacteria bacterium RIFCSPHIGHO2_02_FULL_42_58]OGD96819.1 MAG: 50S ribosomal protein L11 [Candidatus Curtissbacteria bacterium RIFCSPHIGHO2_12_FULL_42_33]OGD99443.1 MAG: 50S ribosomal protein L11 [Candidatus Curtissbacteria bacterium RIFCSPLOWO2_01_FULL_42_50]OGE03704.1 MAG: 50S ribosomal protein L11 [Candidatus Curtissbacteria bacterium 
MAKKVKTIIKLNVQAGEATAAPPVGPALGQHGLPIMDFIRSFNEKTADLKGNILPVVITVYEDRTFSYIIKKPPVSEMIKKATVIEKGAGSAGKTTIAKLTRREAAKIAEEKMPDLNTKDLSAAIRIVEGTARSMGVEITE